MSELNLLLRSLPYLRAGQIPQRAWRVMVESALLSLGAIKLVRTPSSSAVRDLRGPESPRLTLWRLRSDAEDVARAASEGTFEYLGISRDYGADIQWIDPTVPRLWTFRLHSFDFAWAMMTEPPRWGEVLGRIVTSWHQANPPRRGDPWHPYVVSERLINLLGTRDLWIPNLGSSSSIMANIYRQARFLALALERDIGGNHLIREATALVSAGHAFRDEDLRRLGLETLKMQLPRQILADGGHEELSPSYHLEVLVDLLETKSLLSDEHPIVGMLDHTTRSMADFAVSMCHPDGDLANFNDSSRWPVRPEEFLRAVGFHPERRVSFPDSGYFMFGEGKDRLFFDVGQVSPRDLPPHAHCDLLSVEASVSGERMIVNSGTGDYPRGPWRDYWRSTRAHSTVEVDRSEQSEVWHSFRMARRASPRDVEVFDDAEGRRVSAAHDGYRRLQQPVVHRREVIEFDGVWVIADSLEGLGIHQIRSYLHLHPEVEARIDGSSVRLERGGSSLLVIPIGTASVSLQGASTDPIENWYASELGDRLPAQSIVAEGALSLPSLQAWLLLPRASSGSAVLETHEDLVRIQVTADDETRTVAFERSRRGAARRI